MEAEYDPLQRFSYDVDQVFSHAPNEFEIEPRKMSFDHPCWLTADISLKPKSDAAKKEFLLSLNLENRIDAYAKTPWDAQLSKGFGKLLKLLTGQYASQWLTEVVKCRYILEEYLRDTESIFKKSGSIFGMYPRFIKREEFVTVPLGTILKESAPDRTNIYLAEETRSYARDYYLRIHFAPPVFGSGHKYMWFEKRLPSSVQTEDVIPWFLAIVNRLPKKHRPSNLKVWINRFLTFDPYLAGPTCNENQQEDIKPRLIFVLGPICKIGYRCLYHLNRNDIKHLRRHENILTIIGATRHGPGENPTFVDQTFHLITLDAETACEVEIQILNCKKTHFGLDSKVLGMIVFNSFGIHSLNVPIETIQKLCLKPGQKLELDSNDREKVKTYNIISPDVEK